MIYLVTGAGPVGATVAEQLAEAGETVRLATRSGRGPQHPRIERVRLDVNDPDALRAAADGVAAIFHCIHGTKYRADTWRAELPAAEQKVMDVAAEQGAVVVFPESLYSYGPVGTVMTEQTPSVAQRGKLGIRTELLAARRKHRAATVSVVASDFYGPKVLTAHAGDRLFPQVLAGRTISVIGSLDRPHSFTYVPDLAAAMIAAARDEALWNSVLHAPTIRALTQRELITAVAAAAQRPVPRLRVVPVWALRAAGVFLSDMAELGETGYMFNRPFVMSSELSEQRLAQAPTPLATGIQATLQWWRGSQAAAAPAVPDSDV